MSGTYEGGRKAAVTIKDLYGSFFYEEIGRKGGRKTGVVKGFAAMDKEKHRQASAKGGRLGKRGAAL